MPRKKEPARDTVFCGLHIGGPEANEIHRIVGADLMKLLALLHKNDSDAFAGDAIQLFAKLCQPRPVNVSNCHFTGPTEGHA